jgi:hypothetical protein
MHILHGSKKKMRRMEDSSKHVLMHGRGIRKKRRRKKKSHNNYYKRPWVIYAKASSEPSL